MYQSPPKSKVYGPHYSLLNAMPWVAAPHESTFVPLRKVPGGKLPRVHCRRAARPFRLLATWFPTFSFSSGKCERYLAGEQGGLRLPCCAGQQNFIIWKWHFIGSSRNAWLVRAGFFLGAQRCVPCWLRLMIDDYWEILHSQWWHQNQWDLLEVIYSCSLWPIDIAAWVHNIHKVGVTGNRTAHTQSVGVSKLHVL